MRKVFLVIPVSAAVIAVLVAYRYTRPRAVESPAAAPGEVRQAPPFELFDEHMRLVRLKTYLGRHKLLVVFAGGESAEDAARLVKTAGAAHKELAEAGAVVFAVTGLRPAENRQLVERAGAPPFPLLSDILEGRLYAIHREWGAYDAARGAPRQAVFIVDRAGIIRHSHLGPDGLGTPADWVRELNDVR